MKHRLLLLVLTFINITAFGQIGLWEDGGNGWQFRKIGTVPNQYKEYRALQKSPNVPFAVTDTINALESIVNKKEFLSTGLIKNGAISINADPTKYNISAGVGVISNFDDPNNPVVTPVNFNAITGHTPAYLTSGNITYVAINSSGAIVESASPFTMSQRRDLIILGAVIHSNLTIINVVNNISAPTNASTNQLHDFMEAVGSLNITGNKYSANGANLQLNKSAGSIFKFGVNFAVDWKNPHTLTQSSGTALTFRYRTQNGTEGSDVTSLDPSKYDLSNVLTAVPNNKFSIQTVTMFQTGLTRIQYGQNFYDDLASAQAAIFTREFNVEANIKENGITRSYIILKNNATSLLNTNDTKIVEAQKFGGVASGGIAVTSANIIAALGYTPENVANKATDFTTVNNTLYPTVQAAKNYVDGAISGIPPVDLSNYVDRTTNQSIDGIKSFNDDVEISYIGGMPVNAPLTLRNLGGLHGANNAIPVELIKLAYAGALTMNYKYQPDEFGTAYVPYDITFPMHALEAGAEGISIHGMKANMPPGSTDNNVDDRMIFKGGANGVRTTAIDDLVSLDSGTWIQNFAGVYAENINNPLFWSSGAPSGTPFGYYRKEGDNIKPSWLYQSSADDDDAQYSVFRKTRGTLAVPTATLANDNITKFEGQTFDGTDYHSSTYISLDAAENTTNSAAAGQISFGGVNSGTTSQTQWAKLKNGLLGVGMEPSSGVRTFIKQIGNYGLGIESLNDDSRLLIGESSGEWSFTATYDSNGSFSPISFFTSDARRVVIDTDGTLNVLGKATVADPPVSPTDVVRLTDLSAYAPLASPALTGTPTAPTATAGTNTMQIATTAFVMENNSGRQLAQLYTDVTTSGTSETDLYDYIIPINTLINDGDKIAAEYFINESGITSPAVRFKFIGTSLTTFSASISSFSITVLITRSSSSTARIMVTASNSTPSFFDVGGIDWTSTNSMKITGQTSTGTITAKAAIIEFKPKSL